MLATINSTEQFSLDGPVSPWVAIIVALGLLVVFTWSLMKERHILGSRQTILFWLLRATALGIAVWMLLAPTKLRVEVSTARKVIAIIADISGSMRTIDPPGTSDDLRWALSQTGNSRPSVTRSVDEAITAAFIAEQHLQSASNALAQHQRESLIAETISDASLAIKRIQHNANLLVELLSSHRNSEPDAAALSRRVARDLENAEFTAFAELQQSLEKGRTPADRGWRESLPDLQIRVSSVRRRLTELARVAESLDTEQLQKEQPQVMAKLHRSARLSRVADFLEELETGVLNEAAEQAEIRVGTFDKSLRMMKLTAGQHDSEKPGSGNDPTMAGGVTGGAADGRDRKDFGIGDSLRNLFSADAVPSADDQADGDMSASSASETNLSAVLEQLDRDRREQSVAAAIIVTDASHNSTASVNPRVAAAALKGTPVYVVPVGNTQYVRDVLVQSVFAPAVAMRNDDIVVEAVVQAHDCEGEQCIVQLVQNENVLDTRTIPLESGYVTRRVRFDRKLSEAGLQQFAIRLLPIDQELSDLNNQHDFEVNVTRSDIKILLADEMPRWEYRYLAQLFRRDPKVELDELLFHPRVIATGRRQQSKAFPTTADEWDQYDVAFLGDVTAENLTAESQTSLITYLRERGGTVIIIAGKESMPQAFADLPLAGILPVTQLDEQAASMSSAGLSFLVTEAGRNHSALMIAETEEATQTAWNFVNQFAPLHDVSRWRLPRPSATTLIAAVPKGTLNEAQAAATSSFLCWQPVGRGRVIYFSGPETFRLRFLRGDLLHYRFWGQLLRWAMASDLAAGSELVRIRSDKSRYVGKEDILVTVRLADGAGHPLNTSSEVKVIARSGEQEHSVVLTADEQIPGQFIGTFQSLPPGEYSLEPMGDAITQAMQGSDSPLPTSSLTVRPELPMELLDTRSDRALAQQIADITGGQVIPPTAAEEVLRLTNLKPEVTQKMETRPLWVEWKYLWVIFGCLNVEWIARKIKGLS